MEGQGEVSKEEVERIAKEEADVLSHQDAQKTTKKSEWDAIAEKSYQMFLNYDKNPNWKLFSEQPCKMYSMDAGDRVASRGIAEIPASLEDIVKFLENPDNVKIVDVMNEEGKMLLKEEKYEIDYFKYKAPWPVSSRDFVLLASTRREGNKVYLLTKSIDYDYPIPNKVVRAEVYVGSYCVEELSPNNCKVTYISDADPKGWIPGPLKNNASKNQAQVPGLLLKVFKK